MNTFFTQMNFWKLLLILCVVALVIDAIIVIIKVLLVVALIVAIGYGTYRLVQHIATRKQRQAAKRDAEIDWLETENERLEKLLHP